MRIYLFHFLSCMSSAPCCDSGQSNRQRKIARILFANDVIVRCEETIMEPLKVLVFSTAYIAQSMIDRLRPKSAHGLVIESAMCSAFFKRWTCNIDEQ